MAENVGLHCRELAAMINHPSTSEADREAARLSFAKNQCSLALLSGGDNPSPPPSQGE